MASQLNFEKSMYEGRKERTVPVKLDHLVTLHTPIIPPFFFHQFTFFHHFNLFLPTLPLDIFMLILIPMLILVISFHQTFLCGQTTSFCYPATLLSKYPASSCSYFSVLHSISSSFFQHTTQQFHFCCWYPA